MDKLLGWLPRIDWSQAGEQLLAAVDRAVPPDKHGMPDRSLQRYTRVPAPPILVLPPPNRS